MPGLGSLDFASFPKFGVRRSGQHGYGATTDLLAVGAASRAADRAYGDARSVVVPAILGSAARARASDCLQATVTLGYLRLRFADQACGDYSSVPNAMVVLAGVVASATGVFGVFARRPRARPRLNKSAP